MKQKNHPNILTQFTIGEVLAGYQEEDFIFHPGLEYAVALEELQIPEEYLDDVYVDKYGDIVVSLKESQWKAYLQEDWYHALLQIAEEAA